MFHTAIKTEATKVQYDYHLEKFRKYFIIKDYESLLKIPPKRSQEMVEDYIISLKSKNLARGTIKNPICALELFYSMNDIILNFKKIRKMLPEQKKAGGGKPYSTEQVQAMLKAFSNDSTFHALTLFMSASGVRSGFSEELKMRHLTDLKNGCYSVLVYADTKDEYMTFIHQEAVKSLENYFEYRRKQGESLGPDSWVFCNKEDCSRPLSSKTITHRFDFKFRNILDCGKKIGNRYEIEIVYGLRKRWNTIMKNNSDIDKSFVEKMFAHTVKTFSLDTVYHKPDIEKLFSEYQKGIRELMISDEYRLRFELDQKDKELSEIEDLKIKLENIQEFVKNLQMKQEQC